MSKQHSGWFPVEELALRKLKATFDTQASFRKAQLAYLVLLRVANLEGDDSFSRRVASLADDMGYNYDEAAQALKLVEKAGLLEITQQTVPGSKEKAPSVYRVVRLLPDNPARLPGKEARLPESQKDDDSPRVSKNSTKNITKNSTNISADAEAIYELYPKKVARPKALKAISKALKKTDAETLKKGISGYQFNPDPQFIPNPATWFNEERWSDRPMIGTSQRKAAPDYTNATSRITT